jgi:molybdopterin-containing oxidoreductase family membrane subunit
MAGRVIGLFDYADTLIHASQRMKGEGFKVEIISPVPLVHEIEHVEGEKKSPLRYFTLCGGIFGFFFGTCLTLVTSALYVLPRGGRPIFSITPTLIISYETTILLGVIATLFSFFALAGLPYFEGMPHYRGVSECPEAAIDSFGLVIEDAGESYAHVERILKECGASKVRKV